jgi:hypothetical protein
MIVFVPHHLHAGSAQNTCEHTLCMQSGTLWWLPRGVEQLALPLQEALQPRGLDERDHLRAQPRR